ncbi:MAG: hypothetical protein WC558_05145 [Patulibacter sp.]
MAADDCPNAAVRAQQQSQHLPGCLAYEKVTPHEKNGARPANGIAITADGQGILYDLNAGIEDAQSFVTGNYRARRTSAGSWTTNGIVPSFGGERLPLIDDLAIVWDTSADLSRNLIGTQYAVDPNDQGMKIPAARIGSYDQYLREPDGSFTWLVPDPSAVDSSNADVTFADASVDLDRIVLQTVRPFDARTTGSGVAHLYVRSAEHGMVLASELPDGSLAPEVDSVRTVGGNRPPTLHTFGVSADGRRVAFTVGSQVFVRFDADDPARAVTREAAVGPNGQPCTSNGSPYRALSADGVKLVFFCLASSVPGTLPRGVYMRDLDGGPQAVQRVRDLGGGMTFLGGNADLSRFYYADDAERSLYRVTDGTPREIGRRVTGEAVVGYRDATASVDGEYLTFTSDADFGVAPSGITADLDQVYLYAAGADELTCVSCRTDGGPTDGRSVLDNTITPVNTAGTVPFTTENALVPEDTNGVGDAYAWIDGRAVLLSSGTDGAASTALGSSADGSSLFFVTADPLVRDDVDGGADDIYVVRENAGVLVPDPPAECASNCQEPSPRAPGLPRIVTGELLPGGNLVESEASASSRASATLTAAARAKGTRTTVRVKVSGAGSIRVSGAGLRQATVTAKKAGTYKLTVRLSAHGTQQQRKRGKLAVRVTARFTPKSGASVQARKTITFTATTKGGR